MKTSSYQVMILDALQQLPPPSSNPPPPANPVSFLATGPIYCDLSILHSVLVWRQTTIFVTHTYVAADSSAAVTYAACKLVLKTSALFKYASINSIFTAWKDLQK
jgi:hypothetical protein